MITFFSPLNYNSTKICRINDNLQIYLNDVQFSTVVNNKVLGFKLILTCLGVNM